MQFPLPPIAKGAPSTFCRTNSLVVHKNRGQSFFRKTYHKKIQRLEDTDETSIGELRDLIEAKSMRILYCSHHSFATLPSCAPKGFSIGIFFPCFRAQRLRATEDIVVGAGMARAGRLSPGAINRCCDDPRAILIEHHAVNRLLVTARERHGPRNLAELPALVPRDL